MPRIIVNLFWILLFCVGGYFSITWAKQYYTIKMAETCTNRMWLIEEAKQKYSKDFPGKPIDTYGELLPYLPFTGFPMCPYGGEYKNPLSITEKTTCTLNGEKEYEPDTPGVDLKKNGFMDLAKKREAVTLLEFFQKKFQGSYSIKDSSAKKEENKKKLFGTQ